MMSCVRHRVLVVSPALPSPTLGGANIRVFHILKHLARHHEVSLLAYAGSDDAERLPILRELCASVQTIQPPAAGGIQKRLAQTATLFSPRSYRSLRLQEALQQAIQSTIEAQTIDVIQVETSQLGIRLMQHRQAIVVDEHDLEFELLLRSFRTERHPARKLFNWLEYTKLRREELSLWRRVDGCIVTSEREAAKVRSLAPETPIASVPNGVDVEYFAPPKNARPDPAALVFTATLNSRPNVDAALYFVREIFPRILQRRPDATFTIVGTGAPAEITRLAGPRVVVTGRVPDVRPFAANASVFVVPLRFGSGTRLKVLEALAMQMPVVSTPLGAEGIPVRHGEHVLLADDAADFAASVIRLLENPAIAQSLARRGHQLVLQDFRWEHVTERLGSLHEQALERAKRRH